MAPHQASRRIRFHRRRSCRQHDVSRQRENHGGNRERQEQSLEKQSPNFARQISIGARICEEEQRSQGNRKRETKCTETKCSQNRCRNEERSREISSSQTYLC